MKEAEQELQTKKAEMKKMKEEKAEKDEEIKMLRGQLEELRDEMNELTKKKQLMEEELEEKKRAIRDDDQYKEENEELQSEIEDLKEKLERKTADFTNLCSNLLQKSKIKAEVSDKLRLVTKDIHKVRDEIFYYLASEDIEKQLQMSHKNSYVRLILFLLHYYFFPNMYMLRSKRCPNWSQKRRTYRATNRGLFKWKKK